MSDFSYAVSVDVYSNFDGQLVLTAATYGPDRDLALMRIETFFAIFGEQILLTRRTPTVETNNGISKASCRFVINAPEPGPIVREKLNLTSVTFGTIDAKQERD